jgi:hypothetical protein
MALTARAEIHVLKEHDFSRAANGSKQTMGFSPRGFVSGHDFSHAEQCSILNAGL